jgi:hypothetical protein
MGDKLDDIFFDDEYVNLSRNSLHVGDETNET